MKIFELDGEIKEYDRFLALKIVEKIRKQIINFEKYMLYPTIILIHPHMLMVVQDFYQRSGYNYTYGPYYLNDIIFCGLKVIEDYSVKIEDMVEVRGVSHHR